MLDPAQPAAQTALLGTLITVANLLVLTVIGWLVTRHIAKMTRDSTEAIAKLSRDLTQQQIEVARAQVDVNRQTQAMSLLKDRTAIKEELFKAIDARENEITFKSHPDEVTTPEALYALWAVENKARVLFGDDVMNIIKAILDELKVREDLLMKLRKPDAPFNKELNDNAGFSAFKIAELTADLGVAINRYSSMGHIRMLEQAPSGAVPTTL